MEQLTLIAPWTCRKVKARSADRNGRHHLRCVLPVGHRGTRHKYRWVLVERYQ